MFRLFLLALLVSFSAPALAIYKCESNGKITYSDEPCRGGKVLDLQEPVTGKIPAADAAHARQEIAREKKEVQRLEKERHKSEGQDEKLQHKIAAVQFSKQKKCTSLDMRKKWSEEDAATAHGKSVEKAKRRARRQAEKYEIECGKK